jgi:fatty-acyl-CoA synthase
LPHDGSQSGDPWVRSGWASKGYYRDDRDKLDADGWFPTGDVATIDELGYMRITDRTKDVIKSGGEWISSVQLENIVYEHPSVGMAAVIGASHAKWEERPVLIVVPKQGDSIDEEEMLDFLRPRVAKWWLPDRVLTVEQMPMTATGKIRKTTLRAEYGSVLQAAPAAVGQN